jgi:hypothetical protein
MKSLGHDGLKEGNVTEDIRKQQIEFLIDLSTKRLVEIDKNDISLALNRLNEYMGNCGYAIYSKTASKFEPISDKYSSMSKMLKNLSSCDLTEAKESTQSFIDRLLLTVK